MKVSHAIGIGRRSAHRCELQSHIVSEMDDPILIQQTQKSLLVTQVKRIVERATV
jgi:hypothetical protein